MNEKQMRELEAQIGYTFREKSLLCQAMTRRSYTNEQNDRHNEVLEFIGDTVLGYFAVRLLSDRFGQVNADGRFYTPKDEGDFSRLKTQLVRGRTLARRAEALGLPFYMQVGRGESADALLQNEKTGANLFEAVLGAVAIDCDWDTATLREVTELMLEPATCFPDEDGERDFVALLQNWYQVKRKCLPPYVYGEQDGRHTCTLALDGQDFCGTGGRKSETRRAAAEAAYLALEAQGQTLPLALAIGTPDRERAVGQLHELWQKGIIDPPQYHVEEAGKNEKGHALWRGSCYLTGYGRMVAPLTSSKAGARRAAAYAMLSFMFEK